MGAAILTHETQHEGSYNACLAETTIFERLEGIVDSTSSNVTDAITLMWNGDGVTVKGFLDEFHDSGDYAKGYAGAMSFFYRAGSSWTRGTNGVAGHGGGRRSRCN